MYFPTFSAVFTFWKGVKETNKTFFLQDFPQQNLKGHVPHMTISNAILDTSIEKRMDHATIWDDQSMAGHCHHFKDYLKLSIMISCPLPKEMAGNLAIPCQVPEKLQTQLQTPIPNTLSISLHCLLQWANSLTMIWLWHLY